MKKRISILLTVALIISSIPGSAFTSYAETEELTQVSVATETDASDSDASDQDIEIIDASGSSIDKIEASESDAEELEEEMTYESELPEFDKAWGDGTGETTSLPSASGNYYLTKDIVLAKQWEVTNASIKLDLNGHVVKQNTTGDRVILVTSGGTLDLYDTDPTATHNGDFVTLPSGGVITGGNHYQGAGVFVGGSRTFNMYGGTIYNCKNDSTGESGGGVFVNSSAVFNLYNGTIDSCTSIENGGGVYVTSNATFNMSGGTIKNCTAPIDGGGVYVSGSGKFSMSDGSIDNCKSTGTGNGAGWGGGVCVADKGSFDFESGTIKNCTAERYGGGVHCRGTMTMADGASIENCKAIVYAGGGLCVDSNNGTTDGTLIMTGGTVKDCECKTAGGGMYLCGSGKATITGGEFSENVAGTNGGGIYCQDCTITLGGDVKITDNTKGDSNPVSDNLFLIKGTQINIGTKDNAPTSDMSVGISLASDYSGSPFNGTCDNLLDVFTSDDPSVALSADGNAKSAWALLQDALNGTAIAKNSAVEVIDGVVTLKSNIVAGASNTNITISNGQTVTLDLNGYVISRNLTGENPTGPKTEGRVIYVTNGNLTIQDSNSDKQTHKFSVSTNASLLGLWQLDEINGTLTVSGGCITGGYTGVNSSGDNVRGGGIYVNGESNNATVTLKSGNIVGNTARGRGGGVCAYGAKACFNMTGGSIQGNTVYSDACQGGGLSIAGQSSGNVTGGLIAYNKADSMGGIEFSGNELVLTDVTIQNNEATGGNDAQGSAGGIYLNGTSCIISGNTIIEGNIAKTDGGGIFVDSNGNLKITDTVIIRNNTAGHEGADIYSKASNKTTGFSGGDGSEDYPYLIADNDDLTNLAKNVNNGTYTYEGCYFKVTDDITYTGTSDYLTQSIGQMVKITNTTPNTERERPFKGTFDGNNKTITLAFVGRTDVSGVTNNTIGGLFGYVVDGTVKNVIIGEGSTNATQWFIGGIVGRLKNGTIDNCVNAANIGGNCVVGGICGEMIGGTIKNCVNSGTVLCGTEAGGICGRLNGGSIYNCYNTGKVSITGRTDTYSNNTVGGICGSVTSTSVIKNCITTGEIEMTGDIDTIHSANRKTALRMDIGIVNDNATLTFDNVYSDSSKKPKLKETVYESDLGDCIGEKRPASDFTDGTIADLLNEGVTSENGYRYWNVGGSFKAPDTVMYKVTATSSDALKGTLSTFPTHYEEGDEVTLVCEPADGCLFVGYELDGIASSSIVDNMFIMPDHDVTVTATFAKASPSIFYKDQGGEDFSGTHEEGYPQVHSYGTDTALKGASKDGFTFDGWFTNENCTGTAVTVLGATEYTDDITLFAKWTEKKYSIINTAPESEKSTNHGYIKVDVTEAKEGDYIWVYPVANEGYTLEWLKCNDTVLESNSASYDFEMPNTDVTLTAKFTDEQVFLYENGTAKNPKGIYGTLEEAVKVATSGNVIELNKASDENVVLPEGVTLYTYFSYTGNVSTNITGKKIVMLSLFGTYNCQFFVADAYSIEYKDKGGADFSGIHEEGYPTEYALEEGIYLDEAAKSGFDFRGWFDNPECTGERIYGIYSYTHSENLTFYADWVPHQTQITYIKGEHGYGGTSKATASYSMPMPEIQIPSSNDGYVFAGYFDQESGGTKYYNADGTSAHVWDKDVATCSIYAQWTPGKHTVTIVSNNPEYGTVSLASVSEIEHDTAIATNNNVLTIGTSSVSAIPAADTAQYTYTFKEWSGIPAGGTVVENVTVTAVFERNYRTYSVTLNKNSGSCEDLTSYTVGTGAVLPIPTRTGYVFDGWYDNSGFSGLAVTEISSSDTGDKEFFAKWLEIIEVPTASEALVYDTTEKTGVVSGTGYIVTNATATDAGEYTATVTLKSGYIWSDKTTVAKQINWSIAKAVQVITANETQTFAYGQTGKSVTATALGGATLSFAVKNGDSVTVNETTGALTIATPGDTVIIITAAETSNYEGGSKDVTVRISNVAITKPTASDIQYVYDGTLQTFEVNGFDSSKMEISNNTQTDAGTYTVTVTPKTGYEWNTDGECTFDWEIAKASQSAPELSAFTVIQESLKNKKDGSLSGITDSMQYSSDGGSSWTDGPATLNGLSNEVFKIRYAELDNYLPSEALTITFTASETLLTVSFIANGHGSAPASVSAAYGATISEPTDPTETGYTFAGWYKDASCNNAWNFGSDTVTEDTTLFASWTVNRYYIVFDANGGTGSTKDGYNFHYYGKQYTLPIANNNTTDHCIDRYGYEFAGWALASDSKVATYADQATFSNLTAVDGATVTLYAVWTPTESHYTIRYYKQQLDMTYSMVGSEGANGATEALITVYPSPTYTGFKTPDPKQIEVTASPTVTVDFYYDRLSYELTWDLAGGTASNAFTPNGILLYEQPITAPIPSRAGYTFYCWSPSVPSKMPAASSSYTAVWSAIWYNITYSLNDGEVEWYNPEDYTIETDDFTLYNPEREGYTFTGWTGTGITEASMSVTIPKGSMGDRSYTATWEINKYPVTINSNNTEYGSVSLASIADVPYGTEISAEGNVLTIGEATISAIPSEKTYQYTYSFKEWTWTPIGDTVTGATEFIAVFERTINKHSSPGSGSGKGTAQFFTGTEGDPVKDGTWIYNVADDTWSYKTSKLFVSTWGYIFNPYATDGQQSCDWFYFGPDAKMLTGWQQIMYKEKMTWFYLNPVSDNRMGACQMGGVTPDGYTVNSDGSWAGF